MEITEISIKNIKGFGEPIQNIKLDNSIKSGKVNLLLAPNGWGKSSLTAAFESLKREKLDVPKENKYKQDETLDSELVLTIDNNKYTANKIKNDLKDILIAHVIHCDTYPVAITKNMGKFSTTKGYIGVKSIEITKIPTYKKLEYKVSAEKNSFGQNNKLLKNLESNFSNFTFMNLFSDEIFESCKKLSGKKVQAIFSQIIDYIHLKKGTEEQIRNTIDNDIFSEINRNENYVVLKNVFCSGLSELDAFTNIYQIISFVSKNPKRNITNFQKYYEYQIFKEKLNANIKSVDTTWKNIECTEHDGSLWVEFPNADLISNGQRDILTFTVHLLEYKAKLQSGKKYLLIIDEVFDYLDDANVLAAQYYLTNLLNYAFEKNIEITLCLLTHLDPKYFRAYAFNQKILNVCYLKDVQAKSSEFMKTFIAFRQSIGPKKKDANIDLYNKLSKYCFHYHLDLPNFKADIIPYHRSNLKENWCEGDSLFIYLTGELNKYLADSHEYDPYAVSLAIRIGTEKKVYEQLSNDEDKNLFMNVHCKGTKDKIEFAEEKNLIIPDAYYILCLIHGESDHIEYDENHKKFNEKPVIYKLNNPVVKHMVAKLFDFEEGTEVPLSKIH